MALGFIRDEADLKYLILFALRFFPYAITESDLLDAVFVDEAFGYFEFSQAFKDLQEDKFVSCLESFGEKQYLLTPAGNEIIGEMASSLPRSVRDKAEQAALRIIAKARRDASIQVGHKENEDGTFTVDLSVLDGEKQLLNLSMMVYTARQCALIEQNFKQHAENIYAQILSVVSNNPDTEE
jgi:hypothetical protein